MHSNVAVIGGGVAGIATAYALSRRKVEFDWFEGGSQAGGLWRQDNDNGRSPIYDALITNTSTPNTTLFGYRIAEFGEGYLRHRQVLEYLERFLDYAELRGRLTANAWVTAVERAGEGHWAVTVNGERREYGTVVVAIGRNWCPDMPSVPGTFAGTSMHALHYRNATPLAGKRVIVAGFGNTGADIAVEAAGCAAAVTLSTRSGGPLASRFVNSVPADQVRPMWYHLLPLGVRRAVAGVRRMLPGGAPGAIELEGRGGRLGGKAPVINDQIAALVDAGRIAVKPEIRRWDGSTVTFADGSTSEADVAIWATGYKSSFPFFKPETMKRNGDFRDRYCRVVAPGERGLYFVGQAAVVGPVFPVIEAQAVFAASAISGSLRLPAAERMAREAAGESARNRGVLSEVSRGEDTVEAYPYVRMLQQTGARLSG